MHALIIAAMLAGDPRAILVGTWDGESICTPVRPACHGKEVGMGGTVEYTVNDDATSLTSEYTYNGNHLRWSFSRTGNEMRGTLVNVPDGTIIRNIHVAKK